MNVGSGDQGPSPLRVADNLSAGNLRRPIVNAGPAIKINSNQRYATSSATAAHFRRSCEAADRKEDAIKAYGQLIQWDYNYKDVRDRLAALE